MNAKVLMTCLRICVLAQQCNGRGIEVVSLLSACGSGNVERLAVDDHQALVCLERKGYGFLKVG